MKPDRLNRLRGLTRLVKERDIQAVATLQRKQATLTEEARQWQVQSATGPEMTDPGQNPPPMSAYAAWQDHALRRRILATEEAARLAPEIELARARLARSFGRERALEKVIHKLRDRP